MSAVSGPGPVGRIKQILQNISDYLLLPLSEGADKEEVAKGVYMEIEEMIDWCEDIDIACGKPTDIETTLFTCVGLSLIRVNLV